MAQVDIDLGSVKGPKGDKGDSGTPIAITGQINEYSTDNEAASARAVYRLVLEAMEAEY